MVIASENPNAAASTLEEVLLPLFDVSDTVALEVEADADAAWRALLDVDLIALGRDRPLVGALGAARALPELVTGLLKGDGLPARPHDLSLRTMAADRAVADGDWVLLGERPREIALGLVGRFWRPVIEYRSVPADEFTGFDEPGWAKTVYALSAAPLGAGRTQLRGTMRTATTDEVARRRFRRYWTVGVGSGARLLVAALLDAAAQEAVGDGGPVQFCVSPPG